MKMNIKRNTSGAILESCMRNRRESINEDKQENDGYPRYEKKKQVAGALEGGRAYADLVKDKILYNTKTESGLEWKPFKASQFKYTLTKMGVQGANNLTQSFDIRNDTWFLNLDKKQQAVSKKAYDNARKGKFNLRDMVGGVGTFPNHASNWSATGFDISGKQHEVKFKKHAHEFGLDKNKDDDLETYMKMATDFFNAPLKEYQDMFVAYDRGKKGWKVYRYDDTTKYMGVASADGTEISFFSLEYVDDTTTKRTDPAEMFDSWLKKKKISKERE
jgi:hypothetical protein